MDVNREKAFNSFQNTQSKCVYINFTPVYARVMLLFDLVYDLLFSLRSVPFFAKGIPTDSTM